LLKHNTTVAAFKVGCVLPLFVPLWPVVDFDALEFLLEASDAHAVVARCMLLVEVKHLQPPKAGHTQGQSTAHEKA
jgi:hypothetical protein